MKKRMELLKKEHPEKNGKYWTKVKRREYIHFLEDVCEIYGIELEYENPVSGANETWKYISRFKYAGISEWISVKDNIELFRSVHDKVLKIFIWQQEVIA